MTFQYNHNNNFQIKNINLQIRMPEGFLVFNTL